jgi:hypothetical protein
VEIRCSIEDADAEAAYLRFRDGVCVGKSRRYAMLCKGADGIRCKVQNSGRCLDPDTPWHMVRAVVEPMFRFDHGTEWVALFTVEHWKGQLDAAVAASLDSGRPWTDELSAALAAGLETRPRLIVTR